MNKFTIVKNASYSVVQSIFTIIIQFLTYRYLYDKLGIENLGLWSLIVGTVSAASVANFGMNSSVVKFAAQYSEDKKKLGYILATSFLFNLVSVIFVSGLFLIFADKIIFKAIEPKHFNTAKNIIPWSVFNFVISSISIQLWSACEGLQLFKIKSIFFIGGHIIMFSVCFLLVPEYGLMGTVIAQILQSAFIFIGAIIILLLLSKTSVKFFRFDFRTFKELFRYGLTYQFIGWIMIFFDPVTKYFITKNGGLELTGYYELANKLVTQVRSIIISAAQTLIPVFSKMSDQEELKFLYNKVFKLNSILTVCAFSLLISGIPIISKLWLGVTNIDFIIFSEVLVIGWMFNMLCAPAYFSNLGLGYLKPNLIQHLLYLIINIIVLLLSKITNFYFFIYLSLGISFVIGSIYLILAYHNKNSIKWSELNFKIINLILIFLIGFLICNMIIYFNLNIYSSLMISLLLIGLIIYYVMKDENLLKIFKNVN